ncbi:MAG: hypothetical protein AAF960_27575 [Bacteroidota bacterium]
MFFKSTFVQIVKINVLSSKISESIEQLEERGFEKTIDSIAEYSPNADLYFKQVNSKQYIIFNHYNKSKRQELQGFDCWLSTYQSKNDIGKKKAIHTKDIQLTFDFVEDWQLLTDYL